MREFNNALYWAFVAWETGEKWRPVWIHSVVDSKELGRKVIAIYGTSQGPETDWDVILLPEYYSGLKYETTLRVNKKLVLDPWDIGDFIGFLDPEDLEVLEEGLDHVNNVNHSRW